MLFLDGKGHLTSIVTQEGNDGGEDDYHNEIEGIGYLGLRTTPEDEDDLENKKEDRKLNLSLHKKSELQSIIDPPGKEPCGHGKKRGDGSQDEEVETGDLEGRIFKDKIEKDKEGRGHQ
jgi:hypothetical protein